MLKISGIAGITFSKRGSSVKIGENFIIRNEIANF